MNHTVRQYLVELEQQNPVEEPVHEQEQVSTTDPDSTYATKGGTPARLGYYDNYLVDNPSCVIVGVQATAARMSQETVAAQDMLTRFAQWQGREPASVAADTTYGNGEFLQWLVDRSITPYMRTRDSIHRKNSPFYGPERFTYLPETNSYLCPAGQQLNYGGRRCGTEPMPTSGPANVVVRVRKKRNAPAARCAILPSTWTNPPGNAPASWRTRQSLQGTAAKKEGGSVVRGTEESDRTASLAPARTEVRARAVLPGGRWRRTSSDWCASSANRNTHYGSHRLAEVEESCRDHHTERYLPITDFFNTHA